MDDGSNAIVKKHSMVKVDMCTMPAIEGCKNRHGTTRKTLDHYRESHGAVMVERVNGEDEGSNDNNGWSASIWNEK